MSQEPTGTRSRDAAIDEVAKNWRDLNRRMGNDITFDEARKRVASANQRGDLQRDNDNR